MRGLLALNRYNYIFASQSFCNPKRFYSPQNHIKDATFVTDALSLAESQRSPTLGKQVHGHIIKLGLSDDIFVQNNSIKMYTNCGVFSDARKVFDEMSQRNLVSWTLILSGANKNREYRVAMEMFVDMIRTGYFQINEFALGSVMKACVSIGAFEFGLCVHCFAVKIGMERNDFVGSSLLNMYCKSGCIEVAERLFECLNDPDLGCWNAMVGGYVQCGYGLDAIDTVSSMHNEGLLMDEFTFIHALNACSITCDLEFGCQIHGLIVRNGFESTVTLMNSLIDMYFKTGVDDHAWKLFQAMKFKDISSLNTVLAVCCQVENVEQVVTLFTDFMMTGLKPNRITFSILFRMCGDVFEFDLSQQLYGLALRLGLHNDPNMSNCLISMFCRCNAKETARSIFDSISSRTLQNWNEMIHGYNLSSDPEALKLFTKLWGSNIKPDECTFSCAVEACLRNENVELGRPVHGIIIKSGFASNGYLCSSLIHGYAKFGFLTDSYAFFDDKMDIVCWGALISALVDQGQTWLAVRYYSYLKQDEQNPDSFILGSVLNACASIASLKLTNLIHGEVFKLGLDRDEYVASAIIDAYGKSGDVKSATIIFHDSYRFADVALFNTMIMVYANHAYVTEFMEVYKMMKSANLKPSQSTFVSVLSACSHAGLVDLGRLLFRSIKLDYKMDPSADNYGCLVDLLSRNGHLHEAKNVIETMPFRAWPAIWRSFLNGCRIHGEKELGRTGAMKLLDMFSAKKATDYVLLSNIYCEGGNWEDGLKIRKEMVDKGIRKDLGYSWISE
ncbi:pentatricopeptide repeat-containing protein At3g09040, mitochondrial-like [Rutidosis leptorrhynchoides]|uniref:pentatricopeptide repeat-containing protein At3g09040, mitochondrial-like n=1 Tax=Rutidosis leptorrhynchoides TaxID=125765 RepID=UPI003A98DD55